MPSNIDSGWAWMVLVAVTAWNFIVGGTMKSYGLLYVEFIYLFGSSPTETGLIGFVFGIVAMVISPFSGRLSDTYSARWMAQGGGIIACIGMAGTGYASNVWMAVIAFGCIFGTAVGLVDGPILGVLGKYFHKRRTFANGIAFAGGSIGTLVLAPAISILVDQYTIKGAMLVLSGIWLNICVVGALLRPFHDEHISNCNIQIEGGSTCGETHSTTMLHNSNSDGKIQVLPSDDKAHLTEIKNTATNCDREDQTNQNLIEYENTTEEAKRDHLNSESKARTLHSYGDSSMVPVLANPRIDTLKHKTISHQKQVSLQNHNNPKAEILSSSLPNINYPQHLSKSTSCDTTKLESLSPTTFFGSNLSIPNLLYRGESIFDIPKVSMKGKINMVTDKKTNKNNYLKFLKNPILLRDLFILGCGFFAYYTPIVSLPAFGAELGISKFKIAWIIGIIGIIEVPSRIILSYMSDRFQLRPALCLTISFFVTGVCGQAFVFVPNHTTMIAYACVHGVFGGLCLVLMSSVIAQSAGIEYLGSGMGLAVMQMHLAVSLSSTTAGAMKQITGSYGNIFRASSAMYLLGALVYCLTPYGLFTDPYKCCRRKRNPNK